MLRYSIIVPIYNCGKYLRACIDSVLAQDSPSEWELLLVDDGSADDSCVICDEYAGKYPQIHALHQTNGGISAARNAGLRMAKGEYVLFLDGDDLWRRELLSVMDTLVARNPDVVIFPFERFDQDGNRSLVAPEYWPRGETGEEYIRNSFAADDMPFWATRNNMFYRGFLRGHDFWFPENCRFAEDLDFTLDVFPAASSVLSTTKVLYDYRDHPSGNSHVPSQERILTELRVLRRWVERYPNAVVANLYCLKGTGISHFGTKKETRELVEYYKGAADILSLVTGRRERIARFLFRTLGYYDGSKAFQALVSCKHLLQRVRDTGDGQH